MKIVNSEVKQSESYFLEATNNDAISNLPHSITFPNVCRD